MRATLLFGNKTPLSTILVFFTLLDIAGMVTARALAITPATGLGWLLGVLGGGAWTLFNVCLLILILQAFANWHHRFPVTTYIVKLLVIFPLLSIWCSIWALSWFSLFKSSVFINYGMVSFFVGQPLQVIKLLTGSEWSWIVIASIGGALMALALILVTSGRRKHAGKLPWLLYPLLCSGLLAVSCLFVYPHLFLRHDSQLLEQYKKSSLHRTTPGLALISSIPAIYRPLPQNTLPASVIGTNIISMEEYLAPVNLEKIHKPNIIFIVVESLRRDSLRALGADEELMPYLDGMAAEGLVMANGYAQSNLTHFSIPALLSSLYPFFGPPVESFGGSNIPKTLAFDIMKALGYRTAVYSSQNEKWGNTHEFLQVESLDQFFHSESYEGETIIAKEDIGTWNDIQEGKFKSGILDDRITIEKFKKWHQSAPLTQPIFAYLNLQATHFPYEQAYSIEKTFTPSELPNDISFISYPESAKTVMRNRYWNSLRYVDERIQELVTYFATTEQLDNTLFVITGDHGEEFYENGGITHAQAMHEPTIRVPVVFLGPPNLLPSSGVEHRPIQHIDVLPTTLAMLGLPRHPNFQGRNIFNDEQSSVDSPFFLTTQKLYEQNVLIWRGHKYILDHKGENSFFDLEHDPGEKNNIIVQSPQLAEKYHRMLRQWEDMQIGYYQDPRLYLNHYPPRIEEYLELTTGDIKPGKGRVTQPITSLTPVRRLAEDFEKEPKITLYPWVGKVHPEPEHQVEIKTWNSYRDLLSGVGGPMAGAGKDGGGLVVPTLPGRHLSGFLAPLAIEPSSQYHSRSWLKTTGGGEEISGGITLLELDSTITAVEQLTSTFFDRHLVASRELLKDQSDSAWHNYTADFTTTSTTKMILILFFAEGNGTAFFDEFYLLQLNNQR
jgi:arylsulfatase A-like enzyme